MPESTLYDRLGQREGIRTVVDRFYDRLLNDPDLGPLFEDADMDLLRETQTTFLCDAAGGPETYDGTPVQEAHSHVPFTPDLIDRALHHLEASLLASDISQTDAEAVVEAVAAYQEELLASEEAE